MPFLKHDNAAIWYSDQGSGPAILLIHGGLCDPMNGERFWFRPGVVEGLLTRGYRALVPDRRLCGGRTTTTFSAYSWEIDAADMASVVQAAGVERVHIVAGSNGCSTALRLALAQPAMVHSLVLCWLAVPDNDDLRAAYELAAKSLEQLGPAQYLEQLRQRSESHTTAKDMMSPWDVALLRDEGLVTSFNNFEAHAAAALMRSSTGALLAGDLLRGVWTHEVGLLTNAGIPVTIIPADPENSVHPLTTALNLLRHIPPARMVRGFPESPTPRFAPLHGAFNDVLGNVLKEAE
ncbi:MAG: alpha/beta fold hydrolase [Ktedonobacteraceae bacterium]|jgi:pimeloyl-ACP methyl ester carboxylesterase